MSNYEDLLKKLDAVGAEEVLKKAVDDESDDEIDDADDAALSKSTEETYEIKGKDGEVYEAIDGTELFKSIQEKVSSQDEVIGRQDSLIQKVSDVLVTQFAKQDLLIKSMQNEISALKKSGTGRKSMLSIVEKPGLDTFKKSEPEGMGKEEFMMKALDAQKIGKVSGFDIARAEMALNTGLAVPEQIVRKVLG